MSTYKLNELSISVSRVVGMSQALELVKNAKIAYGEQKEFDEIKAGILLSEHGVNLDNWDQVEDEIERMREAGKEIEMIRETPEYQAQIIRG